MNTDTGEMMSITRRRLLQLAGAGFPVDEPEPGRQIVQLPDPVYRQEEQRAAKAKRRAARKRADRSRRSQRGRA